MYGENNNIKLLDLELSKILLKDNDPNLSFTTPLLYYKLMWNSCYHSTNKQTER